MGALDPIREPRWPYLDMSKQMDEFDNLSDSELKAEKIRLLKLLKSMEDKNETDKSKSKGKM